jgi:hypothetical protein
MTTTSTLFRHMPVIALFAIATSATASAGVISLNFSGTVLRNAGTDTKNYFGQGAGHSFVGQVASGNLTVNDTGWAGSGDIFETLLDVNGAGLLSMSMTVGGSTVSYASTTYNPNDPSSLTTQSGYDIGVRAYNADSSSSLFMRGSSNGLDFSGDLFPALAQLPSYTSNSSNSYSDFVFGIGSLNESVFFSVTSMGAPADTTPEPATLLLFGSGLAGVAFFRRRRAS